VSEEYLAGNLLGQGYARGAATEARIFEHGESDAREVTIGQTGIKAIRWTVHLANKKAIRYNFSELRGLGRTDAGV
jgi:hypothetical protein